MHGQKYLKLKWLEKSPKHFVLFNIWHWSQRYTYKVLQTSQMKLILLCVWAEPAVLGSTKTALKFKYEIWKGYHTYISMYGVGYKLEKWKERSMI